MNRFLIFLTILIFAQFKGFSADYTPYFEEAYRIHPSIPKGMLESIAYNNTRMVHLTPKAATHDCLGMPLYYGVMGLVEDGKGYFENTLSTVSKLSGYSIEEIKKSPRINILAYAKAYSVTQQNKRVSTNEAAGHRSVVAALSEIPQDNSVVNKFAQDQKFYGVLKQLENSKFKSTHRIPNQQIDYRKIFGDENFEVLSADWVELSRTKATNRSGKSYTAYRNTPAPACPTSSSSANYFGALWTPANQRNYGSRAGKKPKYVTIHTIQGPYSSAISWFKNSAARVSAHYVVRASDGQVTQMVCENDKAYHVRDNNSEAIGIEHEGYIDEGLMWYTTEMYESSAALTRDICRRHGINPLQTYAGKPTSGVNHLSNVCTRIKGHQHFKGNNHIDPGPNWDWDRFYRLVNGDLKPEVFTNRKGDIFDPGGPNKNYGDQVRKTYLIKPKNATSVTLEFDKFDTEGDKATPYDYLDIYDGENRDGVYLGRFSGKVSPGKIESKTGAIFMEFRSDCQFNQTGWKASYTSKRKGSCDAPEGLMARGIYAMGATLTWDKVDKSDFYLVFLKRKNVGDQVWRGFKTKNTGLNVTGLAAHGIYQWQVQAVCGKDSSGRTGDNFITPPASVKGAPQNYKVKLNRGLFYDAGGKEGPYGHNEAWLYTITPPNGGRVKLTFQEFETEVDMDVLSVYDGPSTNSPLIGKFSGDKIPGMITSKGNALTLKFISDKRGTGKGWRARWEPAGSGDVGSGDNGTNPGNGGVTMPTSPFNTGVSYPSSSPTTRPNLNSKYTRDFTIEFNDRDKSGKGIASRFYSLAEFTQLGWRGITDKGFFFDDFDAGLHPDWRSVKGNWKVNNGRLTQMDASEGNTNIYAALEQSRDDIYVYQWTARMSGAGNSRRSGIHFFCSDGRKEDRGDSYFIWARDAKTGDQIEIYKVVNDEFSRKAFQKTTLETGKAYEFKTVFNPQKGRIEVYLNNKFVTAWVDSRPFKSGKAISLRTGGSITEFDDIQVFKKRSSSKVKLTVGKGSKNDVRVESPDKNRDALRVSSLIVDRKIKWSKVSTEGTKITFGGDDGSSSGSASNNSGTEPNPGGGTTSGPDPGTGTTTGSGSTSGSGTNTGNSGTGTSTGSGSTGTTKPPATNPAKPTFNVPSSKTPWLGAQYADDFIIDIAKRDGVARQFYLPADYDGKAWGANPARGFAFDQFGRMKKEWKSAAGKWSINKYGQLQQSDKAAANSNIHHPLTQGSEAMYLYHFKARILSKGDNSRFGLHFFANDGSLHNRGNSYMVWFRNHNNKNDKVEIYRSVNDKLSLKETAEINIKPGDWYDVKITYEPVFGKIGIYLNNEIITTWKDTGVPLKYGKYISFRTGSSEVLFDDLRVYQKFNSRTYLGVGTKPADHLRYPNAARIYTIEQATDASWYNPASRETKLKF